MKMILFSCGAMNLRLKEVVTNYMSNALNHLDYDKKIDVQLTQQNGIVTTSVFNTGDPIPEEDLPKVWDKFIKSIRRERVNTADPASASPIVKAIIDGHHQKCGVRNYEKVYLLVYTGRETDRGCTAASGENR